jgi:hypothetical protein
VCRGVSVPFECVGRGSGKRERGRGKCGACEFFIGGPTPLVLFLNFPHQPSESSESYSPSGTHGQPSTDYWFPPTHSCSLIDLRRFPALFVTPSSNLPQWDDHSQRDQVETRGFSNLESSTAPYNRRKAIKPAQTLDHPYSPPPTTTSQEQRMTASTTTSIT